MAPEDYLNFAKKFPSLIQSCGPLQAVAFALSPSQEHSVRAAVANDWADLITEGDGPNSAQKLADCYHTAGLAQYLQLTRHGLEAASWLKRYAEAIFEPQTQNNQPPHPPEPPAPSTPASTPSNHPGENT